MGKNNKKKKPLTNINKYEKDIKKKKQTTNQMHKKDFHLHLIGATDIH